MKRNGTRTPRKLDSEIRYETQIRSAGVPARLQEMIWIRRWKRRPHRTFWIIGPTGERREL